MNDLFSAFGIDEKELQGLEKKPAAKKEKKKKEKKTAAKYKLPIQFCGGHLRRVFTDVNETAWSEEKLKSEIRRTFRELAGLYFKLHVLDVKDGSEEIGTYVKPEILYSAFTQDEKLEFPLEVVAGEKTLWADTKISLDEIRRLWIQEHPEYEGCKFQYDEKQKLLIPFMDQSAPRGKAYTLPVTVGYLDIQETYQAEDFETAEVTMEALREKYSEKYPEFSTCGFAYQEGLNLLFPVPGKEDVKGNTNISIPVELKAGGFSILVQPEDVHGQNSATLDEIREVLEATYPEYSKERTEMLYDKRHFVVPILKSSRKGLQIFSNDPEWRHEIKRDINREKWRVETTPFGIFRRNISAGGAVRFEMTAPKIPWELVAETERIFKRNPVHEYAVQIFFDRKTRGYEIYEPEQQTTPGTVVFCRNMKKEREKVLVMDIHSHGQFHAFFSGVDNNDEKGIRLYMVIGNLDQREHTYALRAGMAGFFGTLSLSQIFVQEGTF